MKLKTQLNRFFFFPVFLKKIERNINFRKKKARTLKFLANTDYKNILIMNCSPFMRNMFRQRPHHFLDFFSKHFDIVLYRSLLIEDVEHLKDNIYLVPYLPQEKLKDKNIVYYLCSVTDFYYKHLIKMNKYGYKIIYDYYDEISDDIICSSAVKLIHRHLNEINPKIIIASSTKLFDGIKTLCPNKEVLLIKNGVTTEDFSIEQNSEEIPEDLLPIVQQGKPIIGYYGYIAKWMDIELVEKLSKAYPNYNFIYIGKIYNDIKFNVMKNENVHFLGPKPYKELPKYAIWFDCCTIPFKQGELAKATSPVKLFEYMAMKKPTVCTRDLQECRGYDGVLMSENHEEFIKNIDIALNLAKNEDIKAQLSKYAKQNAWSEKSQVIIEKIKELK